MTSAVQDGRRETGGGRTTHDTRLPPPVSPLPVVRSRLLAAQPGVVHGITGRVPGLGRADGNLGYGAPRDAADAWAMRRRWCAAIGVDAERLVAAGQVHGATVLAVRGSDVGRGARPGSGRVGLGDALITDEPGVALLSLHADCLPLLLVDPGALPDEAGHAAASVGDRRPAIGVVHAGWRGTIADVAGAAVRAMAATYGSPPERLLAYLGPAIGPCCYEVGAEVAAAWEERAGAETAVALAPAGPRWRLDLRAANAVLLERAGLRPERIERSAVCTRCASDGWFSHRGQGAATGRFGAVIGLIGGADR